MSPDDYLIPTSDMVWIKDVLSRKDEWSQVSLANYYNLEQMKCVKFNRDNLRLCKELGDDDFVCVESGKIHHNFTNVQGTIIKTPELPLSRSRRKICQWRYQTKLRNYRFSERK